MFVNKRSGSTLAGMVTLTILVLVVLAVTLISVSQARAQASGTSAPNLVSVDNFRPGSNTPGGEATTRVDFTFDQPVFLTGGNRTGFSLAPVSGSDAIQGSDIIPSEEVDPPGDDTITVVFIGDLEPGGFARGFVANDTVSSGAQGNETPNIGQAEAIGQDTTTENPDLVSVRLDCQQDQVFFTFDQPLTQEDVVQNTGGLQVYFNDTTRASAQAVDFTDDPATIVGTFTALPEGKTLNDAIGAIVQNGTVAAAPPNEGQAINLFDEVGQLERGAGCGTTGSDGTPGGGTPGGGGGTGSGGTGGAGDGAAGDAGGSGSGEQSQVVDQTNEQTGTATGGGSVVNNASNITQQCQSGQYSEFSPVQCEQIVNLVQSGESAEQAVSQVVDQDQSVTGVQYQYADETPVEETPVEEAETPADETVAEDGAEEVAPEEVAPEGSADQAVPEQDGEVVVSESGGDEAAVEGTEDTDTEDSADGAVVDEAVTDGAVEDGAVEDGAVVDGAESVESTDELTVLPDTGGAPLLVLFAGAMLMAGGLIAGRIFR